MEPQKKTSEAQSALGGHVDNIKISGAEVIKGTKQSEIDFYSEAFADSAPKELKAILKFLPDYYGTVDGNKIRIENALKGLHEPNVMDIKIGTSTLTFNTRGKGEAGIEAKKKKDAASTSGKYGFNVCGYSISATGEKVQKPKFKSYEKAVSVIEQIFADNNAAAKQVIDFCNALKEAMKGLHREVRGASLLIAVDHQSCRVKLIDLASVEEKSDDYVDEGFIKGLDSIVEILLKIEQVKQAEAKPKDQSASYVYYVLAGAAIAIASTIAYKLYSKKR